MVQHTDTVFNVYKKGYRIKEMRKKHKKGQGVRISINMNKLVFKKTNKVMTIDENKRDLFKLIAGTFSGFFSQRAETLAIAKEKNVISNYL